MNKKVFTSDIKEIFRKRLTDLRKLRGYNTQQSFADAYFEKYGNIHPTKNKDSNMRGTIQSWEQGKSIPTAEALYNLCDLLDCDADYLLGRIEEKNHDNNTICSICGISEKSAEALIRNKESLALECLLSSRYLDLLLGEMKIIIDTKADMNHPGINKFILDSIPKDKEIYNEAERPLLEGIELLALSETDLKIKSQKYYSAQAFNKILDEICK